MRLEKDLWRKMKNGAPGFWVRVENAASVGQPDVCGIYESIVHMVELKSLDADGYWLGTTLAQRYWLHTWTVHGGRAWVVARVVDKLLVVWGSQIGKSQRLVVHQQYYLTCDWKQVVQAMHEFTPPDRVHNFQVE